ncbi:AI-2E family transporter YdiK [Klebsiella aerogenes]|uniref:AI-2E family transporter YdiK n=1 Tax=Klebsiella aerogenes TaxID=548 RepID=UPI000C77E59F|nr:AI-2E family transporter YdiK [Klebsiella aerogenes]ELA1993166.1 AI-2E family transporter YdiK [Klebsiella aerogenes]MDN3811154.1 AI-2E family transporter YdiK [Klebsiella aerogenes]HCB3604847.1 AI-2E family transporter YdiK [Klebsiella aerogenes]HDU3769794.1 AI-2E family transporter YdiK [Klebsiella aerogenes]HDU5279740.1 AI-2E family transporter YdiK [Klebsiella aerogenes]
MINQHQPRDIPQILLSVLFLSLIIISCLWVVQPFILSFAWAGTVVIATWPVLLRLQKLLFGKRSLAVLVMTLLLFLLFVIPIALLVNSLVDNSAPLIKIVSTGQVTLPDFAWLNSIPLFGDKLYSAWHSLLEMGGAAIMAKVRPYIGATTTWFVGQAAHIGKLLVYCGLMLLFSALLYWRGERVAYGFRYFATRLASKRGDAAVVLAGQAVRAVALGVVVTALAQAVLGGIGLAISGVPYAALLTVVMIFTCLVQLGPLIVLVPSIIWLYWTGDTTWGTVLLVWSCVVGTMDNVIRPVLIRMGADLPMILILSGVIGGLIAFGMIGLFIGPVLLAVSWRLYDAWVQEVPPPPLDPDLVLAELAELNASHNKSEK